MVDKLIEDVKKGFFQMKTEEEKPALLLLSLTVRVSQIDMPVHVPR